MTAAEAHVLELRLQVSPIVPETGVELGALVWSDYPDLSRRIADWSPSQVAEWSCATPSVAENLEDDAREIGDYDIGWDVGGGDGDII